MKILVHEGLDAVTIHRLARELDLTVGALYRYFVSKDALIGSLTVEVIEQYRLSLASWQGELGQHAAKLNRKPRVVETLIGLAGAYIEISAATPAWYQLVSRMLTDPQIWLTQEQRSPVMAGLFEILSHFEELFEEAVAEKSLSPGSARQRTILLWSAVTGVLSMQKLAQQNPEEIPVQGLARGMTETLFQGWGADVDSMGPFLDFAFSTQIMPKD
jgi:AcrR family transcriptional regulator